MRTTEQMYEGDAALLLAPQAALEGAGRTALNGSSLLHISLYSKAGIAAEPAAGTMSSSSLRIQEEPNFSFGEELIRINPVAAPVGAESNSRLDRVSFNLPALVRAAGSIGRNNPPQLQGNNGQRWQPVQEPVFSTLRTTEPVEGCQPGSIVVLLTGYDTTGAVIATKEQLLPTACQWQPGVFRLPLREIGEGVRFISWRITNSGPSDVYLDELQLQTVEVVQENHYYAFGLDMAGVSKKFTSSSSKHLYQGKELEEETRNYDFHWRSYDQKLGRTWQVDPHAESYQNVSAYSWVANNPLNMIDPDGRDVVETEDRTTFTGEDAASMFSAIKSSLGRGNENDCPKGDCDNGSDKDAPKDTGNEEVDASSIYNALVGVTGTFAEIIGLDLQKSRSGYSSGKLKPNSAKVYSKQGAKNTVAAARTSSFLLAWLSIYSTEDSYSKGEIGDDRRIHNHYLTIWSLRFPAFAVPAAIGDYGGQVYADEIFDDVTQPGGYSFEAMSFVLKSLGIPTEAQEK